MAEYIRREDAINGVKAANLYVLDEYDMIKAIKDIPAVDVIERKDAIPIKWMVEKLTGHPELSYTFTDGIISVIDVWNKENGNQT